MFYFGLGMQATLPWGFNMWHRCTALLNTFALVENITVLSFMSWYVYAVCVCMCHFCFVVLLATLILALTQRLLLAMCLDHPCWQTGVILYWQWGLKLAFAYDNTFRFNLFDASEFHILSHMVILSFHFILAHGALITLHARITFSFHWTLHNNK